jgi:hypothetical protein
MRERRPTGQRRVNTGKARATLKRPRRTCSLFRVRVNLEEAEPQLKLLVYDGRET